MKAPKHPRTSFNNVPHLFCTIGCVILICRLVTWLAGYKYGYLFDAGITQRVTCRRPCASLLATIRRLSISTQIILLHELWTRRGDDQCARLPKRGLLLT